MVPTIGPVSRSSLIGVGIACAGNVLISLALTVQKLAHRRQTEELAASRSASTSGSSTPYSDTPVENEHDRSSPKALVPVLVVPESEQLAHKVARDPHVSPVAEEQSSPDTPVTGQRGTRSPPKALQMHHESISAVLDAEAHARRRTTNAHSNAERTHGQIDKRGQDQDDRDVGPVEVEEGMYLKSKLWWLGLALIAIGEGGNFLSYGFAPASVVAPLGTVALIANCIFAPLILREKFHAKELIGMALAIVGAVTVVYSSNASNPRLDPEGLKQAIRQIPFIVYTSINIALIVLLILLSRSTRWGNKYIGVDVGICALFGGYTVLSTKALSSLASTIFFDAFAYWITWVLVLVLIGTSVLQVKYLNKALMHFQSKEVIPTQFVFFSLAAIIGSAVLYQEFRDVTFSKFVNFAFGIATTFFGVHLLTSFSEPEQSDTSFTTDRPAPARATSSASLNLLLPSTSRQGERTPLLIPTSISPETYRSIGSPGAGLQRGLVKRTSTGDFTAKLGLSSQAGLLLLATTPPTSGPSHLARRERSVSRTQIPQVSRTADRLGQEENGGVK